MDQNQPIAMNDPFPTMERRTKYEDSQSKFFLNRGWPIRQTQADLAQTKPISDNGRKNAGRILKDKVYNFS